MNYKHLRTTSYFLLALPVIAVIITPVLYNTNKSSTILYGGIFLFIGSFILAVALLIFCVQSERKARTKGLEKISGQFGWNFEPQPEKPNFLKSIPEILNVEFPRSLPEGESRNFITGKIQDWDFAVFDLIYTVDSGEDKREAEVTLFVLKNRRLRLPVFRCEPKKIIHKFFKFFFKNPILFENHPEFSRKYYLYGPNETAVRQTFNAKVLTYFQQITPLTTIGAENYLIVYKQESVCPPEEIPERLNKTFEMANLF